MKIIENTPDRLVAEDAPWGIGIGLIFFVLCFVGIGLFLLSEGIWAGLIFMFVGGGLGLGGFWAFVRRVQVIFDEPSGMVILRRQSIFDKSEERHPLAKLLRAEIEASAGRDSDGNRTTTQRILFVFDEGHLPLTETYSNASGQLHVARQINEWLAARRTPPGLDSTPRSA